MPLSSAPLAGRAAQTARLAGTERLLAPSTEFDTEPNPRRYKSVSLQIESSPLSSRGLPYTVTAGGAADLLFTAFQWHDKPQDQIGQ
jgi:hypothetical protein